MDPPTAKVQSMVDAEIDESGKLVADMGAKLSAGALRVSKGPLTELPGDESCKTCLTRLILSKDSTSRTRAPMILPSPIRPCLGLEPECVGRFKSQVTTTWPETLWTVFFFSGRSTSWDTRT